VNERGRALYTFENKLAIKFGVILCFPGIFLLIQGLRGLYYYTYYEYNLLAIIFMLLLVIFMFINLPLLIYSIINSSIIVYDNGIRCGNPLGTKKTFFRKLSMIQIPYFHHFKDINNVYYIGTGFDESDRLFLVNKNGNFAISGGKLAESEYLKLRSVYEKYKGQES
jgi:hypothetical protein